MQKWTTSRDGSSGFAKALLSSGYDIRMVQELLGHRSAKPTMIDTCVLSRGGRVLRSPADLFRGGRQTRRRASRR